MEAAPIAPFPAARRAIPPLSGLAALGIGLRPAVQPDIGFLRRLYAETRAPELIAMPWSPAEKAAFCDSQFALQHMDYVRRFARGDFWIVTQAAGGEVRDIGRLTLDRRSKAWCVVDIAVGVESRGRGVGAALIRWVQASASAAGAAAVTLSVASANHGALALYRRLGFVDRGEVTPFYRAMEWRP